MVTWVLTHVYPGLGPKVRMSKDNSSNAPVDQLCLALWGLHLVSLVTFNVNGMENNL